MRWIGLAVLALVLAGCAGGERVVSGGGEAPDFQVERAARDTPNYLSRELRVLFLERRFRYDARALNEALKRDRGLRYQGYFFDAQSGWTQPASQHSEEVRREIKPLTQPFELNGAAPADNAEFKKLGYDVIVLGDIDAKDSRFKAVYWEWLEEWVREGGGLVLHSGAAHNPKAYADNDAFGKLFPMTLAEEAAKVDASAMKHWALTAEGNTHAICKLADDAAGNAELWGGEKDGKFERGLLNGLYWHVAGAAPRDGTTVLAHVANAGQAVADGDPLLAVRQHGKGRVVWIGTDDTWLWREQVGDAYFYRFWSNAMGWAADAIKSE